MYFIEGNVLFKFGGTNCSRISFGFPYCLGVFSCVIHVCVCVEFSLVSWLVC